MNLLVKCIPRNKIVIITTVLVYTEKTIVARYYEK